METNKTNENWSREDRDLLIELRTEVSNIRADIKDLKDGTAMRISNLEQTKAEKEIVEQLQQRVNHDIEVRIRILEELKIDPIEYKALLGSMGNNNIYLKWTLILVTMLVGIMSWHILGFRF